jgi:hypothetical protein
MSFLGYSNYQNSQINSLMNRLSVAEITVGNNYVINSAQAVAFNEADTSIVNLISANQSLLNVDILSLTHVDESLLSKIDSHKVNVFDVQISSLQDVDSSLDFKLQSFITNDYNPAVESLQTVDSTLQSYLDSHIVVHDTAILSLQNVDSALHSAIDSHIVVFSADVLSINTELLSINNKLVADKVVLDGEIASLMVVDAALNLADTELNERITSHVNVYTSGVNSLVNEDNRLDSVITSHINDYDATVSVLQSVDSALQSTLDSHIAVYDDKVFDLELVDSTLRSTLDSHIDVYDATVTSLQSVDSALQSTIDSHIVVFLAETSALEQADSVLNSKLDSHIVVYDDQVDVLNQADSLIDFNFDGHVSVFNSTVTSLVNVDLNLNSQLSVQFTNYENRFGIVESDNSILLADLNSHIEVYDAKMLALDSTNVVQDGRLTDLESRADSIELDLGNNIQSQINERITIELFSQIASELRSTDSDLYAQLATKVAEEVQLGIDSTQNSVISLKLDQTVYETKITNLDSVNVVWEGRLRAIEEFARVMLATYTVQKPDNTSYDFTGINQALSISPFPVNVIAKLTEAGTGNLGLRLQFSAYGYNTLLNKYVVDTPAHPDVNIVRGDIDSVTRQYEFYLTGTSGLTHIDVFAGGSIALKNTSNETVITVAITSSVLNAL